MANKKKRCPQCSHAWGPVEVQDQSCDACGWPDVTAAEPAALTFDDPAEFPEPEPPKP